MTSVTNRLVRWVRSWWRRAGSSPSGATSGTSSSGVAPPVVHDVTQTHDEVAGYWTDERLRTAEPREQKMPPPGGPD